MEPEIALHSVWKRDLSVPLSIINLVPEYMVGIDVCTQLRTYLLTNEEFI